VDAFELGVLAVVAAVILACCMAARASAGKRVSEFGRNRDRTRLNAADAARRDEEDLREMLAVTNAHRRQRGLPERSVADAMREFGED
jgi:ABC-type protease/lipase transport system fused ATPase/permease subunit